MVDLGGYFKVETEHGQVVERPSREALARLIAELAFPDNAHLTVGAGDDADWYALVNIVDEETSDEGPYQVTFQEPADEGPWYANHSDPSEIADEVLTWVDEMASEPA